MMIRGSSRQSNGPDRRQNLQWYLLPMRRFQRREVEEWVRLVGYGDGWATLCPQFSSVNVDSLFSLIRQSRTCHVRKTPNVHNNLSKISLQLSMLSRICSNSLISDKKANLVIYFCHRIWYIIHPNPISRNFKANLADPS